MMRSFKADQTNVTICATAELTARHAAENAAALIREAIARRGTARIVVATGNSQRSFIAALAGRTDVPWHNVEAFHMDEYVGISAQHPSSFRCWIRQGFEAPCQPAIMHYIAGDAPDPAAEAIRYSALLNAAPIDIAFVGIGENGHIAFNDPPVADFSDLLTVKEVVLAPACRRQQVGEGHFPDVRSVPERALTITCTGLFRALAWISCVPERRKAAAVRQALAGPITTACPASIIRTHPSAHVYLDWESASLLSISGEHDPRRADGGTHVVS